MNIIEHDECVILAGTRFINLRKVKQSVSLFKVIVDDPEDLQFISRVDTVAPNLQLLIDRNNKFTLLRRDYTV